MLKLDLDRSIDQLERELVALEELIGKARRRQAELVADLDVRQVHHVDGARSLQEWLRGRLDLSSHTARDLVDVARQTSQREDVVEACDGSSFERLVATLRLATSGADVETVERSFGFDLAGADRLRVRHRRLDRYGERDIFVDRHLFFQDSLDHTRGKINVEMPGFEYAIVRDAIEIRADQFGDLPGPKQSRTQRNVDALVAISQDSIEPLAAIDSDASAPSGPLTTIFIDGAHAASRGETGAEIRFGPRVGPAVLDEMLCTGRIQLVGLEGGKPVVTSDATKSIPPAVVEYVKWRDGGCGIAGCHSRYRLQVHHIKFRASGGSHDPDNLMTLCWFHHHVVVHGLGFRIDPDSPPRNRRFLRSFSGTDPPG